MKKTMSLMLGALLMGGLLASGCSSGPSAEDLKALEELKAEVASLERQVQDLESQKTTLQQSIADKDAQLKKCNDDKAVVQERTKGM
jgi:outer membrane murein-binding lipoprotein Lpp